MLRQVLERAAGGEANVAVRHVEFGSGVAGATVGHPPCVSDQPSYCCSAAPSLAQQLPGKEPSHLYSSSLLVTLCSQSEITRIFFQAQNLVDLWEVFSIFVQDLLEAR